MSYLRLFKSKAMQELFRKAESLATSDVPILLLGETGTGKNVLAEHIHVCSGRTNGLFLPLNCAALSSSLLESELFGHEKGAFTGATQRKGGYLDLVCGGTLFLDEIENFSPELQGKLLNVLESKQYYRVGGREKVTTEFRLISATNVNIHQHIESGHFRSDLYFRLRGQILTIPPLRERRQDIRLFIKYFLEELGEKYNTRLGISKAAFSCMMDYAWPGNIRELHWVLEAAVMNGKRARIELEHLPLEVQQGALLTTARRRPMTLEDFVNTYVKQVYEDNSHNLTRTAKALDVSIGTVKAHLRKMGLL